ncbi:MAG TPA: trypsin-like peptidase domain-containing protein [Caldilineaceae bacterium]|nr:trypsin-like peptidase domain-containing protein [Caldilineaceae bacterium]
MTLESPSENSPRRPGNLLLWVGLALLLMLLLGCILTFAAGAWLMTRAPRAVAPTPRPAAMAVATRAPAASAPVQTVVIATPEGGADYETAVLENIYQQVNPSVVNVTVLSRGHPLVPDEALPPDLDPDSLLPVSSGSGFVWDTAGHIVTNNHVVEGAEEVQVTFSDGTVAVAEVVGVDPDSDLAVLRIDPEGYNLAPVRLGRMEDVHVGMRVAAIGNPFGLEGTLTSGIVSAIGRSIPARARFSIPDSIQTDAAINPGNSGGPLLNERGEVIGVNAQIYSEVRSNSGVGFAIPVNVVERVVPALIENGSFAHSYMGVSGRTFSPICAEQLGLPKDIRGALVLEVFPDTPAERAGLQGGSREVTSRYPSICPSVAGGDLIIAINGEPVTKFDDVLAYLQRYTSPGDTVTLTIWRDGDAYDLDLTLGARPSSTP